MTIPYYIGEDTSDMRDVKPGWYAIEDDGSLSSGPFSSLEECITRITADDRADGAQIAPPAELNNFLPKSDVEVGVRRSNQNRPVRISVMNEITTSATKAKTAKPMTDSFALSKDAMPKLEVPAEFREMIDKGVAQARDTYAKAKAAGDEAVDLLKTTYATAAKGATGYNIKLIEIARANTGAAFDYAHELLGVKSPSEFIALSTAQMRKQFDMPSAQNRELFALAQQVATEAAEPIKIGVSKAYLIGPSDRKCVTKYRTGKETAFDHDQSAGLFDETAGGTLMKFRLLHDRVVIERIDVEAKTSGVIVIPDTAEEKPQQGKQGRNARHGLLSVGH